MKLGKPDTYKINKSDKIIKIATLQTKYSSATSNVNTDKDLRSTTENETIGQFSQDLKINIRIKRKFKLALLDSGATISVITKKTINEVMLEKLDQIAELLRLSFYNNVPIPVSNLKFIKQFNKILKDIIYIKYA